MMPDLSDHEGLYTINKGLFLGCVALDSGIPMILAPFFLPFW